MKLLQALLSRLVAVILAASSCAVGAADAATAPSSPSPLRLSYDRPAARWVEALPIGNGRVGAMIFGGIAQERLQLNEGTLWAGGPYDPVNPEAKAALPQVRTLVNEGRYREASRLIGAKVMAKPIGQMPYQTVGSLFLDFPGHTNVTHYQRDLDLDSAVARVVFTRDGVTHTREAFANAPHNLVVLRLTANQPGQISFVADLKTPMSATVSTDGTNSLVLRGKGGTVAGIQGQLTFESRVRILPSGGTITADSGRISVNHANEVTLLITAATSYRRFDDVGADPTAAVHQTLAQASLLTVDRLRAEHLADYQALFRRVTLDLGTSEAARWPTPERIRRFAEGNDPQLATLYYQFGRYLLISSSRPGGQPAPLQGLWNDSINPPWGGKYTININTEMNYWPAESGHLAECVEPLIAMVQDLTLTGARTATSMYGARGWVVHHNTDLWRASAPIDGPDWGMWPCGGAWLCLHLWDRYEFSGDPDVLSRIYPILKGACEFFLDTLQPDAQGQWLVTNPSISPENGHPRGSAICAGPTCDMQILRDLFAHTVQAAQLLDRDPDLRRQLTEARARLAPHRIGSAGQLQEWMEDWDMQAGDRHHRHVSHLYGLYPGRDITRRGTPDLAAAVKKSLEIRGDKATGWATAWRICLWTHLGDGDHAFDILKFLLSPERTYPNMFDAHPPFQIDGNFGGAAGISEMLVQSRVGEIEFLPALPKAWPTGTIKGLRARGGFEVDVAWKDSKLVDATVRASRDASTELRYGSLTHRVKLDRGQSFSWNGR